MPDIEAFVAHAIGIANDDRRGYDQPRRMSGVDIDCSELVRESLKAGGFPVPDWMWTGNEINELTARGWIWHPGTDGVRRGDILWRKGHTAVHIGGDTRVEAWSNEFGGASGGKPGDQTGQEVRLHRPALDIAFTGYLRWNGTNNNEGDDMVSADDITAIANAVWNFNQNGVAMRDRVQGTDEAANDLRSNVGGKVWGTDLNGTQARDRLIGVDSIQLPTIQARLAAQEAAIESLSTNMGANPDDIAQIVQKAVADKLAKLKITVS